jgi:hypothetical protein
MFHILSFSSADGDWWWQAAAVLKLITSWVVIKSWRVMLAGQVGSAVAVCCAVRLS